MTKQRESNKNRWEQLTVNGCSVDESMKKITIIAEMWNEHERPTSLSDSFLRRVVVVAVATGTATNRAKNCAVAAVSTRTSTYTMSTGEI